MTTDYLVELFTDAEPGEPTGLLAARCTGCGRVEFPRRTICPACGTDAQPIELNGPARLRVLSAVLAQPPGSLVEPPYDVGVAEFPEGICVIGPVAGAAELNGLVEPVVVEPYPGGRIFGFRTTCEPANHRD